MQQPDIPKNEAQRLKALRKLDILDTPFEERFDRITRMAKRLFDVPIALVSLVDEQRQWFKSCIGLSASETGRDISFCGHAILGDGLFVIPDALDDERFADNPLVMGEPNIRFYAGCPLHSIDGHQLGTLCIIDIKPRDFSEEDVQTLQDLALTVERELVGIQLATEDELTGLINRRGFYNLAQHSLKLCVRYQLEITLVYLDLNKFKAINDNYGHEEGDEILKAFATMMRDVCRESDLYARLGGDEFIMLFVNTKKTVGDAMVAKLKDKVEAFRRRENKKYEFGLSSGVISFIPKKGDVIEDYIRKADTLMFDDKRNDG